MDIETLAKTPNWSTRTRILFEYGYLSEDQALEVLHQHGLSESDAMILVKASYDPLASELAESWKALTEKVVARLKEGEIDRNTAWKHLQDIGYSSVESDVILDYLPG